MATLYIDARNGNDTDSGTTWAAAWKTLGKGVTSASTGDTLMCVGAFNEAVVSGGVKNLTFTASGFAVLDGKNSLATGVTLNHGCRWIFNGFNVKNFTANGFAQATNNGAYGIGLDLFDCVVESCAYGMRITVTSIQVVFSATRCVFRNCTYGMSNNSGGGGNGQFMYVYSCTFTGNTYGVYCTNSYVNGEATGTKNVFSGNTTHIYQLKFMTTWDYNCIDFSSGNCQFGGVAKTSLAAWQAACTRDYNSISVDPLFVDSAKGLLRLKSTSPAVIAGAILGAYGTKLAYGISNNVNTTLWTGATVTPGSGAVLDGNNDWTLASGSSATVEFETADWGVSRNVRKINLQHIYAGLGSGVGNGPTSILDYDKSDTLPETWQYRVAISLDGSTYGAYATKNLYDDINIMARRLKIEVTLRNDA